MKEVDLGVSVYNLRPDKINLLLNLGVNTVQVPLHLERLNPDILFPLVNSNVKIIGKFIPSPRKQTPEEFKEQSLKLFNQYKGIIKIWDFGGEPETRPSQRGCRWPGTAVEFAKALKIFYEEGKNVDPENKIGAGGFISATCNGFFGNDDRSHFLREFFADGALDYMDFCSLDLFAFGYGGRKNIVAGFGKISALLAEFGKASLPITIAETGVPCEGDPGFYHIIQTEREQAISLIQNAMLFQQFGVSNMTWFSFNFDGWGLVTDKLTTRQAFFAYKNLILQIKGATFKGQVKALPESSYSERKLTDIIEWYKFEHSNKDVHCIFLTMPTTLVKVPPGEIAVYNMFGETMFPGIVNLTREPLYFISSRGFLHQGNFLHQ